MGSFDYALRVVGKYLNDTQWYFDCVACRNLSNRLSPMGIHTDSVTGGQRINIFPDKHLCSRHVDPSKLRFSSLRQRSLLERE